MKELEQEQKVIIQYLLGGLDEAARERVEERVISDGKYKEEVLIIEDELVENYLAGTLSETDRDRFRRHYLSSPTQLEKLKIAQALNKYVEQNPPPPQSRRGLLDLINSRSRRFQFASAAALIVILFGGSWLLYRVWRTISERAHLQAELGRLNRPENVSNSPDISVLVATFAPLHLRTQGESNRIEITPQTKILQLRMPLGTDESQNYQAVLRVNRGPEIFKLNGLKVRSLDHGEILVLQIPVRILSTNDYLLTVSRIHPDGRTEDVADYPLRIVAQQ